MARLRASLEGKKEGSREDPPTGKKGRKHRAADGREADKSADE